jgi:hypothetical protein
MYFYTIIDTKHGLLHTLLAGLYLYERRIIRKTERSKDLL